MHRKRNLETHQMNTSALIIPGERPEYTISVDPTALAAQRDALALLKTITTVTTAAEQQDAIAAASLAKGLIKRMETTREMEKRWFLDKCQMIDGVAKNYKAPLAAEAERIQNLSADYQREQDRIAAAALAEHERQFRTLRAAEEKALRETFEKAESERRANLAAIAAANDDAAREVAQRKADEDAAARSEEVRINQEAVAEQERDRLRIAQSMAPAKAEGARIVRTMDYTITDIRLLAFERPDLVTIEPRRALLLAAGQIPGIAIPGVVFHDITKVQAKAS